MPESLPMCIEMELAPHLRQEAAMRAVEVNPANARTSEESPTRFWMPGTRIRVRFLDGDPALHQRVASAAQAWTEYANIEFAFETVADAEIRITFEHPGLWSYVGTDALLVAPGEPTMSLGALTSTTDDTTFHQVVLHEFGHVLGLTHGSSDFELGWKHVLSKEDKVSIAKIYPAFRSARRGQSSGARRNSSLGSASRKLRAALESYSLEADPLLIEELIRLDVAYPEQAYVDESFDLAVAVRQRDAPQLAIDDLPKTISEEGTVYRAQGEEVIRYRIEVIGADCDVQPPHYVILLRKGENAKPCFFQVTAHRAGKRTLFVNAYQEDGALAAQTRMRIEVQLPVEDRRLLAARVDLAALNVELTPREIEQLHEALLSAFKRDGLRRVLRFGLDVGYDNVVTPGSFSSEVFELLEWAVANNKVGILLKQAREENPGNVKLREFAESIGAR